MALSSPTTPYSVVVPGAIYHCMGMVWERNIIVNSSVVLTGTNIYYTPKQFLTALPPEPTMTACPACCRWVFYNYASTGGAYVPMVLMGDLFDESWKNVKVWIKYVSTTQFYLRIETVQTMDLSGLFRPDTIHLSTYDRFMKNHRLNPVVFDNTFPSIYNEPTRYFRHKIEVGTNCGEEGSEGMVSMVLDDQLGGYFWNRDIMFYDYSLQLSVGGVPVTKFSNVTDTKVEIYFKLLAPLAAIAFTAVGIFRLDSIDNVSPFFADIDLNFGIFDPPNFDNGTVQGTIPTAAFLDSVAAVNVSGNLWKIEFKVDNNHITPGAEYRLYTILGGLSEVDGFEPHLFRPIIGGEDPPPVTGTVDWLVKTYHPGNPVGTTNCVVGVAPGERIYIRNRMNKAAWEAAAGLAFDSNFYGVTVHMAASAPPSGYPIVSLGTITDIETDGADYAVEVEFRIPPSWRDNLRYVIFEWIFSTGTVYAPVQIAVNDYSTVEMPSVEWFDAATDLPIGEICVGSDVVIYAVLDHLFAVGQYYPLGVLKLKGLDDTVAEYDGFDSTNLTKLLEAPFTNVYREVLDISKSRYYIDTKDMVTDNYCLLAILKLSGVGGADPCGAYDVELTAENLGPNILGGDTIRVTWNLPIVPPNFNLFGFVVGAGFGSQTFSPLAASGTVDVSVNPLYGPCHFLSFHVYVWYNECVLNGDGFIPYICYGATGNVTINMS